jgi:hypothetical protein
MRSSDRELFYFLFFHQVCLSAEFVGIPLRQRSQNGHIEVTKTHASKGKNAFHPLKTGVKNIQKKFFTLVTFW